LTDYFIDRPVADRTTVRTNVCIWSSVFIVKKESVIIVLFKYAEMKFFKSMFLHISKCNDLFIQNKKNNFALYVLHWWTVVYIKWCFIQMATNRRTYHPFVLKRLPLLLTLLHFIKCNFLKVNLRIQITVGSLVSRHSPHTKKVFTSGVVLTSEN